MTGLAAVSPPTSNDQWGSQMDGNNLSVLDGILQAARDRRQAAAREYMRALASSVTVGECSASVEHDHRQFYLRGLDLMVDRVPV